MRLPPAAFTLHRHFILPRNAVEHSYDEIGIKTQMDPCRGQPVELRTTCPRRGPRVTSTPRRVYTPSVVNSRDAAHHVTLDSTFCVARFSYPRLTLTWRTAPGLCCPHITALCSALYLSICWLHQRTSVVYNISGFLFFSGIADGN